MQAISQEESAALHENALVVDCHTDVVHALFGRRDMFGRREKYRRLRDKSSEGHVDLPRLKEGGVDCQVFAIWSDPMRTENKVSKALELLSVLLAELEENSSQIGLATSCDQIETIIREGRIAALLSLEGGEPLAGQANLLRLYYKMGIRLLGLTWSFRNELAFGNRENPKFGITEAGFEVIKEANKLGVLLDVSHLNEASFCDLAGACTKPFIASHSNSKELHNHSRNLDDRQLKLLADHGGSVGINFNPPFLAERDASLDTVCKHAEYIARLVGSEHVGLGSDYDGIESTPIGLEDVSRLPRITKRLQEDGMPMHDIENILGQSFMRVFREVMR